MLVEYGPTNESRTRGLATWKLNLADRIVNVTVKRVLNLLLGDSYCR
jgi:hypothetical protein